MSDLSRQAAIDELIAMREHISAGMSVIGGTAYEMAIEALREPERKKGKWIIYVISMLDGEGCRCSECGFEGAPYWDYCPNCGADMREESDNG